MEYQVGDTVRIIDDPSQAKRLPRSALRRGCTDSNTFPLLATYYLPRAVGLIKLTFHIVVVEY